MRTIKNFRRDKGAEKGDNNGRMRRKTPVKSFDIVHKFGWIQNKSPLFITRMTYCLEKTKFIMLLYRGHKAVESTPFM